MIHRRKQFTIYRKIRKTECLYDKEINLNTVRHVHIDNARGKINCKNYFPNATELTFMYGIEKTIDNFNQILPLIQITKLHITCIDFKFDVVIDILKFIPNICTLTVDSVLFLKTECTTIENNEIFQLVSNTNVIQNFTIRNGCRFEQIKFFLKLFPRLQHINMNISWEEFKLFFNLSVLKISTNHNCLHSICFENYPHNILEDMMSLIEPKDFIDKYSKKLIDNKCYLWW